VQNFALIAQKIAKKTVCEKILRKKHGHFVDTLNLLKLDFNEFSDSCKKHSTSHLQGRKRHAWVSVPEDCACVIPNSSAKQCDWLSHAFIPISCYSFYFLQFEMPERDLFLINVYYATIITQANYLKEFWDVIQRALLFTDGCVRFNLKINYL